MELANCIVALGGDVTNTVPKHGVTAGEICVLQAIHGSDAVTEVERAGEVERSNKDELTRLRDPMFGYGKAMDGEGRLIVNQVYPGAAARVHDKLDELELEEGQWKAERPKRRAKKEKPADVMA